MDRSNASGMLPGSQVGGAARRCRWWAGCWERAAPCSLAHCRRASRLSVTPALPDHFHCPQGATPGGGGGGAPPAAAPGPPPQEPAPATTPRPASTPAPVAAGTGGSAGQRQAEGDYPAFTPRADSRRLPDVTAEEVVSTRSGDVLLRHTILKVRGGLKWLG